MKVYNGDGVATISASSTGSVTDGVVTIAETVAAATDVDISIASGNISM